MRTLTLAACLLFSAAASASARTWTVNPFGTGDAPTIQAAIDLAAAGDRVLLTDGTFTGSGNKNVLFSGRAVVLESENGAASTIIDCEQAGRALHIVLGEGADTVVRGITVVNGAPTGGGGAILISNASPVVDGCVFEKNSGVGSLGGGGGAVFCGEGAGPFFRACVFRANANPTVDGVGGAVSLHLTDGATFEGCTFVENETETSAFSAGGSIFAWGGDHLVIRDCDFRSGRSRAAGGVGLAATTIASLERCTFTDNAALSGGALGSTADHLSVIDCVFRENRAGIGGAAEVSSYDTQFGRCRFERNRATDLGGAIAGFLGDFTVKECVFLGNQSSDGSCIFAREGDPTIISSTFYRNTSDEASVLSLDFGSVATVDRCIFVANRGTVANCSVGTVANLSCCDIQGNTEGDWVGCLAGQATIDGNFSADPRFCDESGGDLTLRADSPCAPPGVTNCGLVGALAANCSPISIEPKSWGHIKGAYRE